MVTATLGRLLSNVKGCSTIADSFPAPSIAFAYTTPSPSVGMANSQIQVLDPSISFHVVLSRETPLSEIKRIRDNSSIEIEYFCQGALCVAFSGNCYLSSYLHDASGNRGKCKQLCRLPYSFSSSMRSLPIRRASAALLSWEWRVSLV